MTTSGTTLFNPSAADLTLLAFSRIGKSGSVLTQEHLSMAAIEANLLNVEWANKGYNLWKQETIPVVAGSGGSSGTAGQLTQAGITYSLASTVLAVTAAWIETANGDGTFTDRFMGPMSAYEYAAMPNKQSQGPPTSYWFNRQIVPVMNYFPAPDSAGPYFAYVQAFTQIQDVVMPGGVTLDAPYRFLDAFAAGLAARLAVHYAPQRAGTPAMGPVPASGMFALADAAWFAATKRDTEAVNMSIMPNFSRYQRR